MYDEKETEIFTWEETTGENSATEIIHLQWHLMTILAWLMASFPQRRIDPRIPNI